MKAPEELAPRRIFTSQPKQSVEPLERSPIERIFYPPQVLALILEFAGLQKTIEMERVCSKWRKEITPRAIKLMLDKYLKEIRSFDHVLATVPKGE